MPIAMLLLVELFCLHVQTGVVLLLLLGTGILQAAHSRANAVRVFFLVRYVVTGTEIKGEFRRACQIRVKILITQMFVMRLILSFNRLIQHDHVLNAPDPSALITLIRLGLKSQNVLFSEGEFTRVTRDHQSIEPT